MDIASKYSPTEIEDKWYAAWMEAKVFKSTPDEREPYTIVMPPPRPRTTCLRSQWESTCLLCP
ncbi:MAG: hypothetical protein AAFQ92_11605, partial [Bacteroidota bacterium]